MKIKVAIMFGGASAEAEISKKSAQVVQEQLPKEKYDSKLVELGEPWKVHLNQGSAVINKDDFSYLDGGSRHNFDFVFIAVHGHPGENGILQGYFDLLKIPYSAPNVLTSAITFNKKICSDYLRYHGITCPTSVTLYKNQLFEVGTVGAFRIPGLRKTSRIGLQLWN